jgi:uncharacterized membrane protein
MLSRLLILLPLLLCPMLMLACMWAMRSRETPKPQARGRQQELSTAARVAQLERELAELRARLPETSTEASHEQALRPHASPAAVKARQHHQG